MPLEPVLHAQAVHEQAHGAVALGHAPVLVEFGLLLVGLEHAAHGLAEGLVAEIPQPGALARLVDDGLGVQAARIETRFRHIVLRVRAG